MHKVWIWHQARMHKIQGLQPSKNPAYADCKGSVLHKPGKQELTDGLVYRRCQAASLTVPSSNKALPTLPSRAAMHFPTCWVTRDPCGAAFKLWKWRLHPLAAFEGIFDLGRPCQPPNAAVEGCSTWTGTQRRWCGGEVQNYILNPRVHFCLISNSRSLSRTCSNPSRVTARC